MRPLALIALVTAVGCATPGIEPDDAPARLAAAESAFAAQSVREGMKAAFLAWLAPGATLFRAGPVDGRAEIARNPDPPIVLDWRPAFVEVAASGDFGLSTGPWRIRSKADPSRPERHGQFISVWRRASGGDWRVWVDVGVSNPGPALWDAPLVATTVPRTGPVAGTVAQAEAAFAEMAARSGDAAATSHGGQRWPIPFQLVHRHRFGWERV